MRPKLSLDSPATYQIIVQGYLGEHWSEWFEGMVIVPQIDAHGMSITRLAGTVIDQADLHGALHKLYDLGLPLISVNLEEMEIPR